MDRPSIDRYEFVTLVRADAESGGPLIIREQCQPISRMGVDGVAVLRTGRRSDPFQMRSGVDVINLASVSRAYALYADLIGRDAYTIVWQGIDYATAYQSKYVVLDVTVLRSRYMPVQSGGLSSSSTAWLECLWTLQPVLAD